MATIAAGALSLPFLAVEPGRGAGERALTPAPAPPSVPGFQPARSLVVHGFRLVLERAPGVRRVVAGAGTVLFGVR